MEVATESSCTVGGSRADLETAGAGEAAATEAAATEEAIEEATKLSLMQRWQLRQQRQQLQA